jgi:hypothetical protein
MITPSGMIALLLLSCIILWCRSRGIDNDMARQMLVFSFGAEVTQHLKHEQLLERLQTAVNAGLASADTATAAA